MYQYVNVKYFISFTLLKVQKILRNVTVSENTFQSFNMEVYKKFYFTVF